MSDSIAWDYSIKPKDENSGSIKLHYKSSSGSEYNETLSYNYDTIMHITGYFGYNGVTFDAK